MLTIDVVNSKQQGPERNKIFQELVKKSKETSDLVLPGTSGKKFGRGKAPAKKGSTNDDEGDSDGGSMTNGNASGETLGPHLKGGNFCFVCLI